MDIANILESVSIIIAAWSVIISLNAWRREYIGKRNLELAEEILALFYEARDAIIGIRSNFGYGGEGSTRKASENESPEEKRIYDRAFVTIERYNKRIELFSKIYSMRYRYMARFGSDTVNPFNEIQSIVNEILMSADDLALYWKDQSSLTSIDQPRFQENLNKIRELESIIWNRGKDDPIMPRINNVVADIEAQSRKILEPSRTDRIKQWFF